MLTLIGYYNWSSSNDGIILLFFLLFFLIFIIFFLFFNKFLFMRMIINKIIRNSLFNRIKTSTIININNKRLILIRFITSMSIYSWHFPYNLISNFQSNIFRILFTNNFLTTIFYLFFLIFLFIYDFWLIF